MSEITNSDQTLRPEWLTHVIEEEHALDERVCKLRIFLNTAEFDLLDPAERNRLNRQFTAMRLYQDILKERIFGAAKSQQVPWPDQSEETT